MIAAASTPPDGHAEEPDDEGLVWHHMHGAGVGSAGLEARLRASLGLLESLGVKISNKRRARHALAFLENINADPQIVRIGDSAWETLAESHHRTALEMFLITYAAYEDRRNKATPFLREKLTLMFGGADVDSDDGDALARNTQFELYVAAIMRLGGLTVERGTPDFRANIAGTMVSIEAKRIRSPSDVTMVQRIRDAIEQIGDSGRPGTCQGV